MALTTIFLPGRVFDSNGQKVGYEEVKIRALDGVTLNGRYVDEQDLADLGLA